MKFLSLLAIAGAASAASISQFAKRDDIDASGEASLPDLSPNSRITLNGQSIVAAGVEDGTNVTLFRFPDGKYYSLEFAQGPAVQGLTVDSNGVCKGCKSEEGWSITEKRDLSAIAERDGVAPADLEKRFFLLHLLGGIINFKLRLLGGIIHAFTYGCFRDYYRPIYIWRGHGHGGDDWCDVGPNGYIHWPNVHIGCDNNIGGRYAGCSEGGTQLWHWNDGTVCPIHVRRGRCREGWSPYRSNHGGLWWWKRDQVEQ